MAFKRSQPGLRFADQLVSPDEMDAYTVYNVANPSTAALGPLFVASGGTAGTSAIVPIIINSALPDYPRNVQFNIHGTHGNMAGTLEINGADQFGSDISETMSIGTNNNGGTVAGTKVFGQFFSGTVSFGTAVGNGTPGIGFGPGTNTLFGLPVKIASTSDVVHYGMSAGTGPIAVGGGSAVGTLVNTGVHAFRPFAAFGGTTFFNVWVKSTYNGEEEKIASGTQVA